jgi:tRNA-dihydrouridine synthase
MNGSKSFEFWKTVGEPKYILAPMVAQSDLPFRLLTKRYGVELAYTPMFHSR